MLLFRVHFLIAKKKGKRAKQKKGKPKQSAARARARKVNIKTENKDDDATMEPLDVKKANLAKSRQRKKMPTLQALDLGDIRAGAKAPGM